MNYCSHLNDYLTKHLKLLQLLLLWLNISKTFLIKTIFYCCHLYIYKFKVIFNSPSNSLLLKILFFKLLLCYRHFTILFKFYKLNFTYFAFTFSPLPFLYVSMTYPESIG